MRSLLNMDTIQIEITNACVNQCSNCTRLVGHSKTPFFMDLEFFKKAVDSLIDFPKMVGMMGGEPLLHPQFEEMALYLHSKIPPERCGLWSTLPKGRERFAPVIAKVFGNVLLNDHSLDDIYHTPVLVSGDECLADKFQMWYLIDHCWIQNCWSASITPKGGFFCEIAAALDMTFQGPGGWPIEPGWWKKTPKDFVNQMERYCVHCGAPYPLKGRLDSDEKDDITPRNLEILKKLGSPKVTKGLYQIYDKGFAEKNYQLNSFRKNTDYFKRIAAKYNLGLKKNKLGFLQPHLLAPVAAT